MLEKAEEEEQTTAVVVECESGISVNQDADGWTYKEVGGGSTIVSLKDGVKPVKTQFPLNSVHQVTLVKGEEAEIIIREAEKGNL